jgi:hypothetical protein
LLSDQAKALRPITQAPFDVGELEARIEELKKRLNMNSSNSSKTRLLRELIAFSEDGHRWAPD